MYIWVFITSEAEHFQNPFTQDASNASKITAELKQKHSGSILLYRLIGHHGLRHFGRDGGNEA